MDLAYYENLWLKYHPDDNNSQDFWNDRAKSYSEHLDLPDSQSSRLAVVKRIIEKTDSTGKAILDIGCGPAGHALDLAQYATSVDAFDLAPEMLKMAEARLKKANCTNVNLHCLDWSQISLAEYGWHKNFNLVLASRTPAVGDLHTLNKMAEASNNWCCIITQVDSAHSTHDFIRDLVPFNEQTFRISRSLYAVFNLLWLQGYFPEIEYFEHSWENSDTLEHISKMCLRWLNPFAPFDQAFKQKLHQRLSEIAVDGQIHEKIKSKIALISWQVQ